MRRLLKVRPNKVCLEPSYESDIEEEHREMQVAKVSPSLEYNFKLLCGTARRNAKKMKIELSQEECSICLSDMVSPIGHLPCKHSFCFPCIKRSSQVSTKCPYCRRDFAFIECDGEMIEVSAVAEEYEEDDEPCYMCGRDNDHDRLLECDFCEYAYCHVYCDPRLDGGELPVGEWNCHSCEEMLRGRGL